MKVAELLESRRQNWRQLEQMCVDMEGMRRRKLEAPRVARFAALYRAACADLALADAYQLPPNTVHYLHQLVGRAHNQLYRSRKFNFSAWGREMFQVLPPRLYYDNCLRLAFFLFWGVFLASMYLASGYSPAPEYSEAVLTEEGITGLEQMYSDPVSARNNDDFFFVNERFGMAGFYIFHNTGIGLKVFAAGLLFGIGGLFATFFNAASLGAAFGHMTKVPQWEHFSNFVTAHGPFELTAIVLSAAAGMRLGFSLVETHGLSRMASLRRASVEAMPSMGAAMVLFFLAALIEGFISPSNLPYAVKVSVALLSSALMMFYFIMLGYGKGEPLAAR